MKLQSKLALFNGASRVIIILLFVMIMPMLISSITLVNTDNRLLEKKERVMAIIDSVGISQFLEAGPDGSYGSYNLLKEEFISLEQINDTTSYYEGIENTQRIVENEIVDYRVLSHAFMVDNNIYLLEIGRSISTITETEKTLRRFAIIFLIIIAIITSITDVAFTKLLLSPLDKIIETKLKNTRYPYSFEAERIKTSTTDFKYLDDSIHEMMEKIEAAFIKEREFIANASHELLTPVSILQNKLENMLSNGELSEENMIKIVEAQKTLSRLKNIIKTLLLISKIENDQYLKNDEVTISELVEDATELIEDRAASKDIRIIKSIESDYLIKNSNRSLLQTMLFNLLNNAVKYNKQEGRIKITGGLKDNHYVLEIKDTGIGMEKESIPHIFNRFKRFTNQDNESYGLGLPIVKTVANFHQIRIDVDSTPGLGSSFQLHFENEESLS